MNTKKCSSCGKVQPTINFYSNRTKVDGLNNWCKICVLDYSKKKRTPEVVGDIPTKDDVGEEYLEKWWKGCKNYYQSKTNNMETLTTNEVELLKKAHSRLFNQLENLKTDFEKYKESMNTQVQDLKMMIKELTPKEEVKIELPEKLVHNVEYKAEVTEVVEQDDVEWNGNEWTNWKLKLKGKEECYYAFCPSTQVVESGSVVRFTYTHPVQLKKLKVIQ